MYSTTLEFILHLKVALDQYVLVENDTRDTEKSSEGEIDSSDNNVNDKDCDKSKNI